MNIHVCRSWNCDFRFEREGHGLVVQLYILFEYSFLGLVRKEPTSRKRERHDAILNVSGASNIGRKECFGGNGFKLLESYTGMSFSRQFPELVAYCRGDLYPLLH